MTELHTLINRMADRLDRCQQLLTNDRTELDPLAAEARKALAQPEPEGPTDEEIDELAWNWYSKTGSTWYQIAAFRAFARAVLARWGRSDGPAVPDGREPASVSAEPSGPIPADGEVAELVAWLRERGQERETLHLPGAELSKQLRTAPFLLTRAADLLERVARRPKPPSLKEQALAVVKNSAVCDHLSPEHEDILRRALEALDD